MTPEILALIGQGGSPLIVAFVFYFVLTKFITPMIKNMQDANREDRAMHERDRDGFKEAIRHSNEANKKLADSVEKGNQELKYKLETIHSDIKHVIVKIDKGDS